LIATIINYRTKITRPVAVPNITTVCGNDDKSVVVSDQTDCAILRYLARIQPLALKAWACT